ncbi:putative carnitine acyl carnitine carrier protein [Botryosphaeria dothidea]|uniref:Carnitine acyl carnitine carrier protein n=1 Tax=Botryosphaeria dothidea TaxID=55169 RepID=A0A8H4IH45_9PEZI|nr:putative carnitine acyl carnitine carrier protein [Botryosphaeria dothidea]
MPAEKSTVQAHLPSKEELKEEVAEATKSSLQSLRALVAGGVGGVCAVVVGHPFDLVKVRLQTAEKGVYSGAMDVVRRTIAREGLVRRGLAAGLQQNRRLTNIFLLQGLYAGVSAPLVGVTPMFAVSFWGYDVGKQLVSSVSPVRNNQFTIAQTSAAGFFSAIPMTLITAPFERVKVLLQIQGQKQLAPGEKPKYSGGLDVVRQLYKEGGVRSVFRGSAMTLARDGPGSAAYFATYEIIKRRLTPKTPDGKPGELSLTAVMAAGGAAGVAMWIPVFPVDTIKSRLQSAEGNPTIGGTIKEIYVRGGGFRAFFPGLGPALARAVPANAATFLGVELAQKAMSKFFD